MMAILYDSTQSDRGRDEFWIFYADDFSKPIYQLGAQPDAKHALNLAMTIHSTWLPDIHQQQSSAEERCQRRKNSVEKDYQHLLKNKAQAVQELFYNIVFPHFSNQTLEKEFEKRLLHEDEEEILSLK
ncbi:hypothetical protein [Nostoc sp. PA-18-2419]|uniref:hypothetical protein n=1 Tax=Nostoc sp. PA-18-2419 TaxID=2575443 RepID=UPI0011098EC2|nr:hypothetical protein [Nostoc sp. PA-18-2419]